MNLKKDRTFQKLYMLNLFNNISMTVFSFILPIVLYEYTKSALAMSTMRIMDFLPNVLLGMLIGVFVDRLNRRKVIIYGTLFRTLTAIIFVFIITMTEFTLWHLYILGFVMSSAGYMIGSASNAIMPQFFDKSLMTDIQAKFALVSTIVAITGPGLLGMMLLWISNDLFLWGYVILLMLSTILSITIEKVPTPGRHQKTSILAELKEGITALFGNSSLLLQTWTIFFSNFASSLIIGMLTFYALDQLHFTKEQLGLMFTISAAGGLIGAKAIGPLRVSYTRGTIYTYSMIVEVLVLILSYFASSWVMLGLLLAMRTAISTMTNIVYLALRQETTPNHLLGRVAGTSSMIMKLALPVGLFIGGIWADYLPAAPIFLISALVVSFNVVLLLKFRFQLVT